MPTVELPPPLVERLQAHLSPGEDLEGLVVRALSEWAELHDGRSEHGSAMAVLLDEIGATARGELSTPTGETLAEWLGLLNRLAGSAREND